MFRSYRILPVQKVGFSLAADEVVLQQTFLHGCIYLLPLVIGLLALIFFWLVWFKVTNRIFMMPTFDDLLNYESAPLRVFPLARFALTGLFFSVMGTVVLFARSVWRREFTRLTLTSRRVVYQTRSWHPLVRSWSLTDGVSITLLEHRWRCLARLVVRDATGREVVFAYVRDAGIFQRSAARARRACQRQPNET
ncbi:MAG: hypothetical protein HQL66_13235 [Magnetococcales bacterium]|nr:hypothetical protein [Magnetococcales bacterium]